MKIVVNGWFTHQLNTGSGQYLSALLSWLPRAGSSHAYFLILPAVANPQPPTPIPSPWHTLVIPTPFDRSGPNLAKLWFEQVSFPRACRRLAADVALVPYWGSPWWRSCPVAVTVHDIIPLLIPLYRGGMLQRAYTALVSATARRAQAVLTDSEAGRRDIIAHLRIPAARVHAIHLAVDPAYRPVADPSELARVRAHYALPSGPFFLYLGGFDARKNVPRLLEAYAALRGRPPMPAYPDRGPAAQVPPLVVAGRLPAADTPFAPDPRAVAARLGISSAVHFTGWVADADKPALYSLALAALFVSEYEGFGLPLLEAQACGCPVITSIA